MHSNMRMHVLAHRFPHPAHRHVRLWRPEQRARAKPQVLRHLPVEQVRVWLAHACAGVRRRAPGGAIQQTCCRASRCPCVLTCAGTDGLTFCPGSHPVGRQKEAYAGATCWPWGGVCTNGVLAVGNNHGRAHACTHARTLACSLARGVALSEARPRRACATGCGGLPPLHRRCAFG